MSSIQTIDLAVMNIGGSSDYFTAYDVQFEIDDDNNLVSKKEKKAKREEQKALKAFFRRR